MSIPFQPLIRLLQETISAASSEIGQYQLAENKRCPFALSQVSIHVCKVQLIETLVITMDELLSNTCHSLWQCMAMQAVPTAL